MTTTPSTKRCALCGELQPYYRFGRSKSAADGLQAVDRVCKQLDREEESRDQRTRAIVAPITWPYEATCLACTRSVGYLFEEEKVTDAHGKEKGTGRPIVRQQIPPCEHCGGRALLARSDFGSLSSPSAAAPVRFRSRLVIRSSVGPVG